MFHALTDGTGATEFLRELVKNYLYLMHEKDGLENVILTEQVSDSKRSGGGWFWSVTTIQMSVARERKKIMLIKIRRESKEYENFRLARRLPQ